MLDAGAEPWHIISMLPTLLPLTPSLLGAVEQGSCFAAACELDRLCCARDEAEADGDDATAGRFAADLRALLGDLRAYGRAVGFDRIAGCHVVSPVGAA